MNRQKLILFVTLIILVAALAWSYANWPRQKTVATLKNTSGQQPATADIKSLNQVTDDGLILRLDLLDREQKTFTGYHRNLFKPIFVDAVKVAMQKAKAVKALPVVSMPVRPVATPPPVVKREFARFTLMGFLKVDDRKTVFLRKDKEIILVKTGDVFAGRYKATSITDQALTILVTDTNDQIVIPLVENRPLR